MASLSVYSLPAKKMYREQRVGKKLANIVSID